jgi:transcriptional regulator with XRE-family HTH domain
MSNVDTGRRLREARQGLGLSQQELAKLAGVSQRAVSYAEKQTWVKQSTLETYAEALGRPLSYFLRPYGEETAPGLTETEAIQQAFAVVCRDAEFGFGDRAGEHFSVGAMRDIVRLYEHYRRVSLLPEGMRRPKRSSESGQTTPADHDAVGRQRPKR